MANDIAQIIDNAYPKLSKGHKKIAQIVLKDFE